MINICRPFLPPRNQAEKWVVLDPFAGGGTSALEVRRIFGTAAAIHSSDYNRISGLIASDNALFFSTSAGAKPTSPFTVSTKIGECHTTLHSMREIVKLLLETGFKSLEQYEDYSKQRQNNKSRAGVGEGLRPRNDEIGMVFLWCIKKCSDILKALIDRTNPIDFENGLRELRDYPFPPQDIKAIESLPLFGRFLFYLVWRATVLNAVAASESRVRLHQAVSKVLAGFQDQLDELIEIRNVRSESLKVVQGELLSQEGTYSRETICPALNFIQEPPGERWLNFRSPLDARDALTLPESSVDIIITDPPYGFNTIERTAEMVALYKGFMKGCLDVLKDRGQLVLCLPDQSHNGQSIPSYASSEWFDREIRALAREKSQCSLFSVYPGEAESIVGRNPLFWRSERALTRKVMHYIVRKRNLNP